MFLATTTEPVKAYGSRWHEFLGDVPCFVGFINKTFHSYACDHCGKQFKCLQLDGEEAPSEPFFCSGCNSLVSVA